jgi:hypothetical protein
MVAFGDRITRLGLAGNAFYITLLPLGVASAAFLFGAMNSAATFTGKVLSGSLQLSGSVVGTVMVVAGGFYFANPAGPFAVTVRVQGPAGVGSAVSTGKVVMELGRSLPEEGLNSKGEAEFKEIPPSFRTSKVRIFLKEAPRVQEVDPNKLYDLSNQLIIIETRSLLKSGRDFDYKDEIRNKVLVNETESHPAMVEVHKGSYIMGSPNTEGEHKPDEVQHRVTISHDFLISSTVITQSEFKKVTGLEPVLTCTTSWEHLCRDMGVGEDYPVVCISWYEAVDFCNRLSAEEGLRPAYDIVATRVV